MYFNVDVFSWSPDRLPSVALTHTESNEFAKAESQATKITDGDGRPIESSDAAVLNDEKAAIDAYQTVGIPISRNFTIDKNGELKTHEHSNPEANQRDVKTKPALVKKTSSTYGDMSCIVDNIFPKLSLEM